MSNGNKANAIVHFDQLARTLLGLVTRQQCDQQIDAPVGG